MSFPNNRPLWNQFRNIIQTVYNPNSPSYDKWHDLGSHWGPQDYKKFENYIFRYLGPQPSSYHKLVRKDQRKGWYPGNLTWMTYKELSNHMIDNCNWITYKGKTQSMTRWSEELGINYFTLYRRYHLNWPVEKLLSKESFLGKNQYV